MAPVFSGGFNYAPVNHTNQLLATIITSVICAIGVVAVLALCRRRKILWPVAVLISGGATFLLEPLFDHLYGLWFATHGQWNAVITYGIHIPIWLPLIYVPYYGAWTVYLVRRFSRGASLASVALLFVASAILAGLAETLYIQVFNLYRYESHQPFAISHYPIFLAVVNGVPPFLASIVYVRLVPKLQGWWMVSLLGVVPVCFAADSFGAGWLYLAARNGSTHPSMLLLSLLALLSVASSFGIVLTAAKVAGINQGVGEPVPEPEPAPRPAAATHSLQPAA
jgi:hypothetical protein